MAIRKICGIETEYGILIRGVAESNPIAASSMLINAYLNETRRSEAPAGAQGRVGLRGRVARATTPGASRPTARWRPRSRPTWSTRCSPTGPATTSTTPIPRCPRPSAPTPGRSCVFDRAAELIAPALDGGGQRGSCPTGQEIVVYKNNSDGKGNSYGCHENYLMDRAVPFGRIVTHVIAALHHPPDLHRRRARWAARRPGVTADEVPFQLTQRADFFEEEVGLETTLKRPIVNTRDEPHCDARSTGACTSSSATPTCREVATFLKVGTTAIVLAMIEDDVLPRRLQLRHAGAGDAPGVLRPDPAPPARAGRRHAPSPRSTCSGSCSTGPASTPSRPGSSAWARQVGRRRPAPVGAGADRARDRPHGRWPTSSTGWPSTA